LTICFAKTNLRRLFESAALPSFKIPKIYKKDLEMKIYNSLKSAKKRHKDCKIVRRKGRLYVINKTNPRFKARQG